MRTIEWLTGVKAAAGARAGKLSSPSCLYKSLLVRYVPRSPARTARWELKLWWLEQDFRSVTEGMQRAHPAFWHLFAYRTNSAGACKAPES